jgi:hypothetical protein
MPCLVPPHLLPTLIAASVCMNSVRGLLSPSSLPLRSTHDTMPAVTLWRSRKGLPSATTHSPTRNLAHARQDKRRGNKATREQQGNTDALCCHVTTEQMYQID